MVCYATSRLALVLAEEGGRGCGGGGTRGALLFPCCRLMNG